MEVIKVYKGEKSYIGCARSIEPTEDGVLVALETEEKISIELDGYTELIIR